MKSTSDRPSRKPLRWQGYDYRIATTYFVTICTSGRQPILGSVDGAGRLLLNPLGLLVTEVWLGLDDRFPLELVGFVAMPDHVHGLLTILPASGAMEKSPSLGAIVGGFKSISWHQARQMGSASGHLWQRGYHDRVVRSDDECHQFEWYIAENPARWAAARMHVQ